MPVGDGSRRGARLEVAAAWAPAAPEPRGLALLAGSEPPLPRPDPGGAALFGSSKGVPVLAEEAWAGLAYEARLELLLERTAGALRSTLGKVPPDAVALLPPGPHRAGHAQVRSGRLAERLRREVPVLQASPWWPLASGMAPAAVLGQAISAVERGDCARLLLGGVDACAAPAAYADPSLRSLSRAAAAGDGPPLSDGAAFILLRAEHAAEPSRCSGSAAGTGDGGRVSVARLTGFGWHAEDGVDAWQEAIEWAVSSDAPDVPGSVLRWLGAAPAGRRAWAHLRRSCPMMGMIPASASWLAAPILGYAGGATLPLLLATAAARLGVAEAKEGPVLALVGGLGLPGACALQLHGLGSEAPSAEEGNRTCRSRR